MTTIATFIRTLGAAALLAVAASLPAVQAHAEEKSGQRPQPNLCMSYGDNGYLQFWTPGSTVKGNLNPSQGSDSDKPNSINENQKGASYRCQDNGNWVVTGFAVAAPLSPLVQLHTIGVVAQP